MDRIPSIDLAETQLRLVAEPDPQPTSLTHRAAGGSSTTHGIQYRSRVMHDLVGKAAAYARSNATVLITGESGTGKEVFARLLHRESRRSRGRFARVNCAALSESLMESELFGHERGSFTGATETRPGRFEWANGGTLLLDEISEIPVGLQAKLLRILEENEFQRVGGNETLLSDVRVIATSNQDLQEQMENKKFRSDLFYRLNVLRIHLPALRERKPDIAMLANVFVQRFAGDTRDVGDARPAAGISKAALHQLCEYDWPGNIRQLRNTIHAACVIADGKKLDVEHLPLMDVRPEPTLPAWMTRMTLESVERKLIIEQLARFRGNKTLVAQALGVTSRTITNKLKLYHDDKECDLGDAEYRKCG